jgi:hypothetical protein
MDLYHYAPYKEKTMPLFKMWRIAQLQQGKFYGIPGLYL